MYLRELVVKNSGPIRDLHVDFSFADNGRPIPHVVVGRNGSGKTNLLSIIADALMQGASHAFIDVLTQRGFERSFFRIVGSSTVTAGEAFGVSILRFGDGESTYYFHENVGNVTAAEAKEFLPESMKEGATWSAEISSKDFAISDEKAESIFESGIHAFFPSSRSELPHWFNKESIESDSFNISDHFKKRLSRPLFVEHALDELSQWLLGVITESRLEVDKAEYADGGKDTSKVILELATNEYWPTQATLFLADSILKIILDDPNARFCWAGRRNPRKIGIESNGDRIVTGLNSLSGGQATLLALFGTLLRYGDATGRASDNWRGIVVIDELDAHMHIDLQVQALPKLIAQFPAVQFIVSTHSPFFVLGMEKQFEPAGVRVVELPTGTHVNAEAYEEFQKALDAFRETKLFTLEVKKAVASGSSPLVLVAGQTDLKYFKAAARVLGYTDLVDKFDWVGEPGDGPAGGRHTGDASLDQTLKFLRANPDFTARRVVLVYDCDAKIKDESFGSIRVVSIPKIADAYCEKGIENLLPKEVFTDEMYENREVSTGYGRVKLIPELRKMTLCESICVEDADPKNFENFKTIMDLINDKLDHCDASPPDSSAEAHADDLSM